MEYRYYQFDLLASKGASEGAMAFILHDLVDRILHAGELPDARWLNLVTELYGLDLLAINDAYDAILVALEYAGIDVALHDVINYAELLVCDVVRGRAFISLEVR